MSYLRSGIFLAPFHSLEENPTLALQRDMELLEHLDRLNYHEAWIGEHHSGGFEIVACPEMFIAAAAERTRHIRLGTGVVSLPYHNPFMVADRMVQLDHMTRGRAMLGVGPGSLVHDAKKIGIDPANQRRMMNESLDVIVALMRGETITRKSDWFDLQDAALQLPCYTPADDGDGGGRLPLAGRRAGVGAARHRHAVDRRHQRRCDEAPRGELGPVRGAGAGQRPGARPGELAAGDVDARGGDPRTGQEKRGIRHHEIPRLLRRRGDVPDRARPAWRIHTPSSPRAAPPASARRTMPSPSSSGC